MQKKDEEKNKKNIFSNKLFITINIILYCIKKTAKVESNNFILLINYEIEDLQNNIFQRLIKLNATQR